ncbi:MAG TPA: putative metal-dependent hydrolase [Caldithrix sp.]|nr:putative metal-dependent hydrolase [Calditrichaceae bacterium]HEM49504.1 putative metal-dependent hydrolase [Caldithrix sp.]
MSEDIEKLRYPIGRFNFPETAGPGEAKKWISEIETLPQKLVEIIEPLNEDKLNARYREDGWTVRQIVHHLVDSHINSYVRFKLALTEDIPTIKPYREDRWADLPDNDVTPVRVSLDLLTNLHTRWTDMLKALSWQDLQKEFYHPENKRNIKLAQNLALYAWHGKHHLAHIKLAVGIK